VVYPVFNTLNMFGLVRVITEGGPSSHTETLLTYLYRRAFVESDFGYATAVGVVVFVMILTLSLTFFRIMKREVVRY
jgi:N-acetylglucosamine transport system permease protein